MTVAMALVLSAAEGRAQTTEWTGAVSTDWSIPANWSSGLPTPASGTAEIDTDLPHPAVIDGSSVAARGVTIGLRGPARLEIRNGGVLSNTWGSIGVFSASNGSVVVAGSGSRWDASNVVTVAEYGIGTLEILGGAEAHLDGLLVGLDGGGPGRRGRGTVTVSGAGSLLTTNWPEIGVFGDYGILNVLDGGRVSAPTDAYVAGPRRGEVAVRGVGSVFEIGGDLETSWSSGGEASLTVSDGGLLDVSGTIILPAHANGSAFLNIGAASGEAAAAPGLVEADGGIVFGAGTGRVVFNHTGADHSFAPMLVGAGEIMVEAGRTRLTGDQSGFTGTTSVTGGALVVDSVLRGTLGVSQAGRLEG
ncbi:MAG TPA: hypothetical protein VLQ65_13050, partial [Saliniramus sp.]|nr:hypothetical protein [Saliniramus sp.]